MLPKISVFLGGTCNGSKWREELVGLLDDNKIAPFNPVVSDWGEAEQARELYEREHSDFVLYTITPLMTGVYSIAEATDDSNKRPDKTIFCVIETEGAVSFTDDQMKSLIATGKLIERNGGLFLTSLEQVANFLNNR